MSITLSPETQAQLEAVAARRGLPLEDTLAVVLAEAFHQDAIVPAEPAAPQQPESHCETLYDFLKDHIGVIDSSKTFPGGSSLSEDTGRKFAEGMAEKHRQGKL